MQATRRGEAERILTFPATLAARFHGLFPGLTADLSGLVNRALPAPNVAAGDQAVAGSQVRQENPSSARDTLTGLGLAAASRLNEQ